MATLSGVQGLSTFGLRAREVLSAAVMLILLCVCREHQESLNTANCGEKSANFPLTSFVFTHNTCGWEVAFLAR